jgi:ABC-type Zn uptake system ZnuABC Zn-binding protein ZnuA
MILSNENHQSARVKKHLDDMVKRKNICKILFRNFFSQRRIEEIEQNYYYATLGDKESNPFSLGIAVRFPYAEYLVRTIAPEREKVRIGSY